MKAAICKNYGGPEEVIIEEMAKPQPKPEEVLVKIAFAGVTAGDARIRGARFPAGFGFMARLALGMSGPRNPILGSEFAGVIEEVGSEVTEFKVGDRVMGFNVFNVHAQYICLHKNKAIIQIPDTVSLETAAALPFGASTALYFLNRVGLKSGESILINGASGEVGVAAVQLAHNLGASVTGICGGENKTLAESLGATEVIDYKTQDFRDLDKSYDVILDTVGNLTMESCLSYLNANGRFATTVDSFSNTLFGAMLKKGPQNQKYITGTAGENKQDLGKLIKLTEAGKLRAVIDGVFGFKDIREAYRRVDTGKKVGTVLLDMSQV